MYYQCDVILGMQVATNTTELCGKSSKEEEQIQQQGTNATVVFHTARRHTCLLRDVQ